MAEAAFNDSRMINNGFQDPMGNDAHSGLEHWLDKFHQPTVPAYTIITDPEYFVFLWFHDANGNLINCPYTNAGYVPQTAAAGSAYNFDDMNWNYWGEGGIQGGAKSLTLPTKCIDLTPFVREASLPEIAPAGAEDIQTLFGNTSAGSFSPYASDGKKAITLQMLDTEYCILDAIFYPWMKDINSPWWYRPDKAYSEYATPFPMATLEVQRPRMRYRKTPSAQESRNDAEYSYYTYKYIGAKPTSYAAFEVNGAGRSNLLRQLSMVADMCIVDLTGDVTGSAKESVNLGNRTRFLFDSADTTPDDGSENPGDEDEDPENEFGPLEDELDDVNDEMDDNDDDIDQMEDGDMPGEDEDEEPDGEEPDDEDPEDSDSDEEDDEEPDEDDEEEEEPEEEKSPWEKLKEKFMPSWLRDSDDSDDDPNGDKNDDESDKEPEEEPEEEKSWWQKASDAVSNVGNKIKDAASSALGWLGDKAEEAKDKANDLKDKAVSAAKKLGNSLLGIFGMGSDDGNKEGEQEDNEPSSGAASRLEADGNKQESKKNSASNKAKSQKKKESKARQAAKQRVKSQSVFGYAAAPVTRAREDTGIDETAPYQLLIDTLVENFSTDMVVFGVVANSPLQTYSDDTLSGKTSFIGGVINEGMSSAFPFLGDMMDMAAAQIGGGLSRITGKEELTKVQSDGAMAQVTTGTQTVKQCNAAVDALNDAFLDIRRNMADVSKIAKSVLRTGYDVGEFGTLIRRISTQTGAKPTPIESFVGIVTGQNTTGVTMM